ncbi:short chain dehydrogenase [Colletotrichum somersetense]|nr:short chain dehydrogenase [Colletotrichum somersetense]
MSPRARILAQSTPKCKVPRYSAESAGYDAARPFVGKVALITGSGRGIGRGMAIELGRRGANVVVNYAPSASAAEEVVAEIQKLGAKAVAYKADISKPAEVVDLFDRAVAHFGRMNFVISNSGKEVWCPEEEVTEELFQNIFDLNTRGLKHCQRGGRVILTSSIAAQMGGIPNHALYAGSKAAVEGFTRAFAVDCGHKGVTVNATAPGGVKTDMFDENAWHYVPNGYKGTNGDHRPGPRQLNPLKRVGVPADVGKVVASLCHPDCEWINGQVIKVTGGGT